MEVFARLMVLRLSPSRVSLVVHLVSQDLSIAGKRAGLAGERSGLFMEMIRVIKEMRDATNGEYPKFAIWENVRGALSSNNGEDFQCVLEEFAHIVEADATIPKPSGKGGKWSKSGAISGNGWSIAWRLFDAQYWGVPQRRQRIALVMDLGGQRAAEVLFERTGVSGNPEQSIPAWKDIARSPEKCTSGNDRMVGAKSFSLQGNMIGRKDENGPRGCGVNEDVSFTLNTIDNHAVAYTLKIRSGCEGGGKGALVQTEKSATLSTLQDQTLICLAKNTSLHNLKQKISPVVFESHSQDARYTQQGDTSPTCTAQWGTGGNNMPLVAEKKAFAMQRIGEYKESEQASTMKSRDYKDATDLVVEKKQIAYSFDSLASNSMKSKNPNSGCRVVDLSRTLDTSIPDPSKNQGGIAIVENCAGFPLGFRPENTRCYDECATTLCNGTRPGFTTGCVLNWIVRRLTPVECERLQGFPDGWTDIGEWVDENGKKHKPADSPRYKALGNSIALPQWYWIFQKMKPYIGENPTLGSLFDGIGGFPLVFESTYGDGTAIWASEVDSFCIAVTKKRFPEN